MHHWLRHTHPAHYFCALSYHFAGQDVPKRAKGVVQSLVVDRTVQVLDEDVTYPGTAQGRVALRPHYAARAALDRVIVHGVQSTLGYVVKQTTPQLTQSTVKALTVRWLLKVDVGITQRPFGNHVSAHSDRENGTGLTELLE